METKPLVGQLDEKEIKALKAKHLNGIFAIESEAGHVAYFRNPDRKVVALVLASVSLTDPLHHLTVLAKNTFIGGSREMLDNDEMWYGTAVELKEKLNGKRAMLVNL